MRRKIISIAVPLSGLPGHCPGKMLLVRPLLRFSRITRARRDKGTRCARPPFIRASRTASDCFCFKSNLVRRAPRVLRSLRAPVGMRGSEHQSRSHVAAAAAEP